MADSSALIWALFAIPTCAAALAYLYWPQPFTRYGVQDVQQMTQDADIADLFAAGQLPLTSSLTGCKVRLQPKVWSA